MMDRIEPRARGHYVHRDTRYVAEWAVLAHPEKQALINVRLGPVPPELRERYPDLDVDRWARVWAKACDLILVGDGELLLVEGELRRPIVAIGELVVYRYLIDQTQSLAPWWRWPVRTILLTPLQDPVLEPVLARLDIEVVVYRPEWVGDYLRSVRRL